jgi:hypothetical protein
MCGKSLLYLQLLTSTNIYEAPQPKKRCITILLHVEELKWPAVVWYHAAVRWAPTCHHFMQNQAHPLCRHYACLPVLRNEITWVSGIKISDISAGPRPVPTALLAKFLKKCGKCEKDAPKKITRAPHLSHRHTEKRTHRGLFSSNWMCLFSTIGVVDWRPPWLESSALFALVLRAPRPVTLSYTVKKGSRVSRLQPGCH